MQDYPLFMPSEELALKGAKNWNKADKQEYFDWFIKIKSERVSHMLRYIDFCPSGDRYVDLGQINLKVYELLCESDFHDVREVDGGKKLNNTGFALVTDFGIYFSMLLEQNSDKLKWVIAKGSKSYHSYNLPVLTGFSNGEYDFIFLAISKFGYALNHLKAPYDWVAFLKEMESRSE